VHSYNNSKPTQFPKPITYARHPREAPAGYGQNGTNTMDMFLPAAQRSALLAFAAALGSRASALVRDDCGDWQIRGSRGHVYAVPSGWQAFVTRDSARGWRSAKFTLMAARVCNDGEAEGAFMFDRLPTPEEAVGIRHSLAIPKKREIGEQELARLRAHSFAKAA